MTVADLPYVVAIEAESFPSGWPLSAYEKDLTVNPNAHYFVAERGPLAPGAEPQVVGYAGLWMQYDEAHVSTLAVSPPCRRRRIGERLLVRLLWCAIDAGAVEVTLEVRSSNRAAQALYAKYGFRTVGARVRYYSDTGEDALIMTTPDVGDGPWLTRLEALSQSLDMV